jgi:hypothetical protein
MKSRTSAKMESITPYGSETESIGLRILDLEPPQPCDSFSWSVHDELDLTPPLFMCTITLGAFVASYLSRVSSTNRAMTSGSKVKNLTQTSALASSKNTIALMPDTYCSFIDPNPPGALLTEAPSRRETSTQYPFQRNSTGFSHFGT